MRTVDDSARRGRLDLPGGDCVRWDAKGGVSLRAADATLACLYQPPSRSVHEFPSATPGAVDGPE